MGEEGSAGGSAERGEHPPRLVPQHCCGPCGGSAWQIKAAAVSGSVSAEFGVTGV